MEVAGPFYIHRIQRVDIGSRGDISPVMTKLHSDTILPERPFLGLSQISSLQFFHFCTFFTSGLPVNTSREAGGELLIGLSVAFAMRHFALPSPLAPLAFSFGFSRTLCFKLLPSGPNATSAPL